MTNPEAANPRHEGQQALHEWVSHAEGARAQLQAIQSELEQARPKTQSIREAVHAELTARVSVVLEAAKKEGERVLLEARQEAAQANQMAMRVRMETERFIKRLEDTIGRPLSDAATPSAPELSDAPAHPWEPHPDVDLTAAGAGVSPGFEAYEPSTPAPSHHANDDETTTDPPSVERIDRRLIDRLWAEP